ncbi:MAG TPA: CHAT domain-containing protein [Streptosporangiaceae bacterium]|nr:CHAT domain-containing protein [Streptosporangiaceae bacterium]
MEDRMCTLTRDGHLGESRVLARRLWSRAASPQTLVNVGFTLTVCGELHQAEAVLTSAVAAARAGQHRAAATANLAFAASRGGDLPRALRLLAEAGPGLTGTWITLTSLYRAETLIAAGLPGEARPLAASVAGAAGGRYAPDGLLVLARAELADGDPEQATVTGEQARSRYTDQGRTGWTLLAEHLLVRARWAAGDRSAVFLRTAVAVADRLERGGWAQAAAEAGVIGAGLALLLGRPAGELLARTAAAGRKGPATLRAAAWYTVALDRDARGDRQGALSALRAGLRAVETHATGLGAAELRARSSELVAGPAELDLRLARSGRALLYAEERRRAVVRPAIARRPADQPRVAELLAELREVGAGTDRVRLETELRDLVRMRSGDRTAFRAAQVGELAERLRDRVLVELVRSGDDLHAVTVVAGRCLRRSLGPYEPLVEEAGRLQFALRRSVWEGGGPCPEPARQLADRLFGPLRGILGDRDLVLAPTGALHGLPFAALLGARPVTVVPSAAAWLHACRRPFPAGPGRALLAAGPGLACAEPEVAALADRYPGAVVLRGRAATAPAVREALDGTSLAHLAAHGEFRADHPLLSELRMADGPLTAYDLEGLRHAPRLVVLSACDAGRNAGGESVLGIVSILLSYGAGSVIAGVTPLADAEVPDFMVAFHDLLAAGHSPAQALAAVPRTPGTVGLQCFGAG